MENVIVETYAGINGSEERRASIRGIPDKDAGVYHESWMVREVNSLK